MSDFSASLTVSTLESNIADMVKGTTGGTITFGDKTLPPSLFITF